MLSLTRWWRQLSLLPVALDWLRPPSPCSRMTPIVSPPARGTLTPWTPKRLASSRSTSGCTMLSTTSSRRWLVSKKRESANHKKDTIQHCPQNQTPMAKPSSIDLFCTSPSTLPPTPFFCEIEKNVHKRVPHICNVKSTACATLIVVTSHPVPEKLRNHGSKTEQRRSKQSLENSGKKCCERPSPPLSSPPHQRKLWHNTTRCIPFLALFPVDNKKSFGI